MLLTVDIGNTHATCGLFRGQRLQRTLSVPTRSATTIARAFGVNRATRALICSVVPAQTGPVVAALRRAGIAKIEVVGRDIRVPLKNRYRFPKQVGQDRLVGAYAALTQFKRDCIVADFGTAMTIDVVTRKGEYLGGIIAPGLEISLEALATRTALLPKVALREPPELLGRDTANSIRSGILYGCAALCDGLVVQLKRQYAPRALVVATGGASPLIAKYMDSIDHLRPFLVLEGLSRLAST